MSHAPTPVLLRVFLSAHYVGCSYGIMDVRQLSDAMCFVKVFDPWGVLQVRRLPRLGVHGVIVTPAASVARTVERDESAVGHPYCSHEGAGYGHEQQDAMVSRSSSSSSSSSSVMSSRCADSDTTCFWMHAADFFQTFTRV